jgi:tetratricopeptide (TPR) repeat protein
MADRYTYVPLIGIFVAAAWGIPDAVGALLAAAGKGRGEAGDAERAARWALPAAAGTLLLALALLTRAQAATWKSSVTLFEHALAVTEGNYLAHLDLGTALSREGRRDEALAHYEAAARIRPDDAQIQYNLGAALAARGRAREAQERYERALALDPGYPEAHNNLGILLARQGRIEDGTRHCAEAVRLRPEFAEARFNLAVALHMAGRDAEAREQVEAARRLGFAPPEDFMKRLSGERDESPAPR